MLAAEEVRGTIRKFIVDNFLVGAEESSLRDEDSFMEKALIDSTGILEVVDFIENTFSLKVEDDELLPENLDSISFLVDFVTRKLS